MTQLSPMATPQIGVFTPDDVQRFVNAPAQIIGFRFAPIGISYRFMTVGEAVEEGLTNKELRKASSFAAYGFLSKDRWTRFFYCRKLFNRRDLLGSQDPQAQKALALMNARRTNVLVVLRGDNKLINPPRNSVLLGANTVGGQTTPSGIVMIRPPKGPDRHRPVYVPYYS